MNTQGAEKSTLDACAGSVGEGWAVPGQGSAPLPLTLDLERPPGPTGRVSRQSPHHAPVPLMEVKSLALNLPGL